MSTSQDTTSIAWADVAKAACVCLVVLMHGGHQIIMAGWTDQSVSVEIWHSINEFLRPIRMPTFFLISGMLAANSILGFREDADRRCFSKPIYLYLVWAIVLVTLVPNFPDTNLDTPLADRLGTIAFIGSPAWFMYGLAIFYLIAKATRNLPLGPVLAACALISLFGSVYFADTTLNVVKLMRCLFFFIIGVHLKERILAFAHGASHSRNAGLFVLYAIGATATSHFDTYWLPVDVVAVAFSLTAWSLVFRNLGPLAGPVRWIGRRTLLVYMLHFPLMALLSYLVSVWATPQVLHNFWLALAYPVIAATLTVPASLALGVLMQRMGLNLMFDLPSFAHRNSRTGAETPVSA